MNLAIVFFATGLWHGATTAFIAWGALHGFFIIVERIGFKKILDKIGFLRYVYTGLVVLFGWVIFRVANLQPALQYIRRMLTPWQYTQSTYALRELIGNRCIVMAVVGVLGMGVLQAGIKRFCPTAEKLKGGVLELVYCMFLIAASMLLLVNGTYSPAIYLNF